MPNLPYDNVHWVLIMFADDKYMSTKIYQPEWLSQTYVGTNQPRKIHPLFIFRIFMVYDGIFQMKKKHLL